MTESWDAKSGELIVTSRPVPEDMSPQGMESYFTEVPSDTVTTVGLN